MDASDKSFPDLVSLLKSWIPWRSEPTNVSRDFWMPDHSCRVCYECDSQFTLFNRRHHCRHCGRIFCAKCTSNWVPASSNDRRTPQEEWETIRVCNYCFKQWEQGLTADNGVQIINLDLSTSPSATSFISTKSSGTVNSSSITAASVPQSDGVSPNEYAVTETVLDRQPVGEAGACSGHDKETVRRDRSPTGYGHSLNRKIEDDNEDFGVYQFDKCRHFPHVNGYYGHTLFDEIENECGICNVHTDADAVDTKAVNCATLYNSFDSRTSEEVQQILEKEVANNTSDECEVSSSLYAAQDLDTEPVDFENNGLLWLPPEPENEEDEREALLFDDEEDGDASGEWGYLRAASSFGSGEQRSRDKSNEEHKRVMKNVVDGHFRALVAQLLQVENLPVGEENEAESWLEIITSLSWEAATLLKPDMSKGGGMDPGGYVKIKCLAAGLRSESKVLKGVVCKKNVAHRRMTSKIEKPRILILSGALEYQRVSNLLSSFDTLLQQEMDHLKMAVAKIDSHHPDVLLVEKSVSRYAQEYLLAKDISLVLNIKRPLLERIARCTGCQMVPSIDHLSSQTLGYCEMFHVDRFLEEHRTAGQGGKKMVKTLMYFEGCPKPLGCTILLRGANGDELKKVKHVVQYGVFAAYHLALETSFLADEGASLPELPLNSPITVALPDKPSAIYRSISTVPGFSVPSSDQTLRPQPGVEPQRSISLPIPKPEIIGLSIPNIDMQEGPSLSAFSTSQSFNQTGISSAQLLSSSINEPSPLVSGDGGAGASVRSNVPNLCLPDNGSYCTEVSTSTDFNTPSDSLRDCLPSNTVNDYGEVDADPVNTRRRTCLEVEAKQVSEEPASLKEEFPPSPSDHQSIVVSLSSRCIWKGTVCERSHLFRIKYYGNFDKPLGRFLRDHLFDQSYRCRSCEMPSEAHVQCYTHLQGTLTISVKKLPEFLLPGEKEGKIWMWHRCLRCPRTNGFPPATRRVVMSDAAWGLSFGKFLELSFSNHAAASRVASCGHSLHRDCLRFYGFGKMVACFRYASIDVHSVFLPPPKLDFNYENQEWIQKELDEVIRRGELLFLEVLNALSLLLEKNLGSGIPCGSNTVIESRRQVSDLEDMLQKEKADFVDSLQKVLSKEPRKGQPIVDILEINRLRRQLLFQSYIWDQRLICLATSLKTMFETDVALSNSIPVDKAHAETVDSELTIAGWQNSDCLSSVSVTRPSKSHGLGVNGSEKNPLELDQGSDNTSISDSFKSLPVPSTGTHIVHDESDSAQSNMTMRRALSDGQFPIVESLSDSLDAAWTGDNLQAIGISKDNTLGVSDIASVDSSVSLAVVGKMKSEAELEELNSSKVIPSSVSSSKGSYNMEDSVSWLSLPFMSFYHSMYRNFVGNSQKLDTLFDYTPIYISSFRDAERQGGARLLLPVGVNDTVIPVYDDEPTTIIAFALVSPDYLSQVSDDPERPKDAAESTTSLLSIDSGNFQSLNPMDEIALESYISFGSVDESVLSMSGSRTSLGFDPVSCTKALHVHVSFTDDGPLGKVKYTLTSYYAKQFEALRRICCPSELDFVRSLNRCKKWGAQGGKSNVFFAKTLDDRFIIKQVTKTELESFIKFAPAYFKYLTESIGSGSPTCLAKILGIYQVASKHIKGGKETKMDVLVMENLLFGRNLTRLYDLKGSSRSRYNPDSSGSNKVLLDQNLIEAMPTSPIFVRNKAKRLLERAVWNDTSFLASVDVMDYSLLVGIDEEKHELVLGIIDFMRQYTWDKHLETWVKASGILGGPKNSSPTVISPKQYKKRFRKAMTTYFLMVPDQWSHPTIVPSMSQNELSEENSQGGEMQQNDTVKSYTC